jgi:exodeoxyribonuclease V alpha subunit
MTPVPALEPRSPSPRSTLAGGLERWARSQGVGAELARALGLAAAAEADGHACVRLGTAAGGEHELQTLRAHPWVGNGESLTPCVLSAEGNFFLWRNWRHEQCIANAVHARIAAAQTPAQEALQADLDILFAGMHPAQVSGQRSAVAAAVGKRLFVLSGGPGTGKTSTVLRLLLLLQRQATANGLPPREIALAAPTGKAAQRLSQALRDGKQTLTTMLPTQATPPPGLSWAEALATIPDATQTLHRLLGYQPQSDRFRHDAQHPLPQQIVVIDEASMVDLAMMRASFDALGADATLILLGDPDQLVSVSAGSVLADLVSAAKTDQSALSSHCVELSHVWRAQGDLAQLYRSVRDGDLAQLQALLQGGTAGSWRLTEDVAALGRQLQAWLARPEWLPLQTVVGTDGAGVLEAFARLRQLQLLTALRSGRYGANELNAQIDAYWRRRHGAAQWYPGRPVLIRHNDYGRRLFNGDVGLTLGIGQQLRVYFETLGVDGKPGLRALLPRELPEHDLAYALTVHQSQGSEYEHVAVLLPADGQNRILSRQLLYTAVSRARRGVEIWSSAASLQAALAQLSVRAGGLRERLLQIQEFGTQVQQPPCNS